VIRRLSMASTGFSTGATAGAGFSAKPAPGSRRVSAMAPARNARRNPPSGVDPYVADLRERLTCRPPVNRLFCILV
jgi:hypothetical protein